MKKTFKLLLITLSLAMTGISVQAADDKNHAGEKLHNDKCTSCHGDEVYTREDRMVQSMDALDDQVNNCMKGAAKAKWTQAQTTSVVDFLNTRYYKF